MTVEELKVEAAKLSADARHALASWLEEGSDVRELRRGELIQDLQLGIDQADRGELLDANEVFRALHAARDL